MNRKVRFGFVLTEDEKKTLIRLSEVEGGLSEAATLRRLIHRAAREHGLGIQTKPGIHAMANKPEFSRPGRVNP